MNKKTILGTIVGASAFVGTMVAHAAPGPQLINPNDGVAWGSWGPVVQSESINPLLAYFVRGQVSKRHARDRLFYNTTSNRGGYFRRLHVACTNEPFWQDEYLGFQNSTDGDKTFFCQSGNALILPPPNRILAQVGLFESYATIDSNAF